MLISQPAISGHPATLDEIDHFFTDSHWLPFRIDGNLAYYDPRNNIVVSDTHRGNIIAMPDGQLAPIDLRVQPLTPTLAGIVKSLCTTHS